MNTAQEHLPSAPALLAYHAPPRSRRPAGVLVLAILGFVLAALGTVVHLLHGSVMIATLAGAVSMAPPGAAVPQLVIAAGSLAFWAALVRACVGAIRMRPWARWGMVRWAAIYLIWVVVSGVAHCTVVTEAELAGMPAGFAREYRPHVYARTATVSAFEAIYPITVMFYMVRRKVVAAFEAPANATGQAEGSDPPVAIPALPVLAAGDVATAAPVLPHEAEP